MASYLQPSDNCWPEPTFCFNICTFIIKTDVRMSNPWVCQAKCNCSERDRQIFLECILSPNKKQHKPYLNLWHRSSGSQELQSPVSSKLLSPTLNINDKNISLHQIIWGMDDADCLISNQKIWDTKGIIWVILYMRVAQDLDDFSLKRYPGVRKLSTKSKPLPTHVCLAVTAFET